MSLLIDLLDNPEVPVQSRHIYAPTRFRAEL